MNREESIKLARDIKAKGGVGPKKIGLSYSKNMIGEEHIFQVLLVQQVLYW